MFPVPSTYSWNLSIQGFVNLWPWTSEESNKFSKMILKYTRENSVQVNIYIKDPFAVKFLIEENALK